jgi:hypothetical protein
MQIPGLHAAIHLIDLRNIHPPMCCMFGNRETCCIEPARMQKKPRTGSDLCGSPGGKCDRDVSGAAPELASCLGEWPALPPSTLEVNHELGRVTSPTAGQCFEPIITVAKLAAAPYLSLRWGEGWLKTFIPAREDPNFSRDGALAEALQASQTV